MPHFSEVVPAIPAFGMSAWSFGNRLRQRDASSSGYGSKYLGGATIG